MSKAKPWWQVPAILGASIVGVGSIGTGIVAMARFLTLPEKVEAAVQQNELQDDAILELKKSNEVWQKIYERQEQQQQQAPRVWWEQDAEGRWYCSDGVGAWWPDAENRCE